MSEIDSYRQFVERLAELSSSEVFSNGQPAHAQVIFETFFKFAKKSVLIFCNKLSEKVYGQQLLINAAGDALNRPGVEIKIITQQQPEAQNFVAALTRWKGEGKPISLATTFPGTFASETQHNFAVMDGKAYRFEPARDSQNRTAFACMNDPEIAAKLSQLFERLEPCAA